MDYEKAFDEVKRQKLFRILQVRNTPNTFLTAIIKICENKEIKLKLDATLTRPIKTNKGVRQSCPFHRFYITYINRFITEWKGEEIRVIKISRHKDIKTHLFADDQVTVTDSEDALQISVETLEKVPSKYGPKISISNTKTMAFKARDPVRNKIVINNNNIIIEQINTFNYPGCSISHYNENYITVPYLLTYTIEQSPS